MSTAIITLGSIGPGPRTDIEQSVRFIAEWNKRFPKYHASIRKNPHDFGSYASVDVPDDKFAEGIDNATDFPSGGIEEQACDLAEELNLDY